MTADPSLAALAAIGLWFGILVGSCAGVALVCWLRELWRKRR